MDPARTKENNLPSGSRPSSFEAGSNESSGVFCFTEEVQMAKRFSDTEKWKKPWFSDLSPVHKCFWFYILDTCSTAGIWDANWKLASFNVGRKLDPEEIGEVFGKQFVPLNGGSKWFIVDFITFQYGHLNPNNPAHKGAIEELRRYSLVAPDFSISLPDNTLKAPTEDLASTFEGAKDKDKDKDKATVKGKGKDMGMGKDKSLQIQKEKKPFGEFENVMLTEEEYGKLRRKFGSDEGLRWGIEKLGKYKRSKGKKYLDDYAVMLDWVFDEFQKKVEALNGKANTHTGQRYSGQREVITRQTVDRIASTVEAIVESERREREGGK